MSRTTDRINTKAPGHIKAQRATRGAPAKARKAMGKSFRLSPPGFTQSLTPRPNYRFEWIELGYPMGPEVDPIDE